MSDVTIKPSLMQGSGDSQSLIVSVISGREYRKLDKDDRKTNNPSENVPKGTSVWQAMQNIVDENGERVFTESDIYRIEKELRRQRINTSDGNVNVTPAVKKAGLGYKLDKLLSGSGSSQSPDIPNQDMITITTTDTAKPDVPEEVTQEPETAPASPQPTVAGNPEIQDTTLYKIFGAAVQTARNQDKFNNSDETEFLAAYDLDENGEIDINEMAEGIRRIQKDNRKGLYRDKYRGKEEADNTEADIQAYRALDEAGFYNWKSSRTQATRAEQVENNQRDAAKAARSMLSSLNKKDIEKYVTEAEEVQTKAWAEAQAQAKAEAQPETQPETQPDTDTTQNPEQTNPQDVDFKDILQKVFVFPNNQGSHRILDPISFRKAKDNFESSELKNTCDPQTVEAIRNMTYEYYINTCKGNKGEQQSNNNTTLEASKGENANDIAEAEAQAQAKAEATSPAQIETKTPTEVNTEPQAEPSTEKLQPTQPQQPEQESEMVEIKEQLADIKEDLEERDRTIDLLRKELDALKQQKELADAEADTASEAQQKAEAEAAAAKAEAQKLREELEKLKSTQTKSDVTETAAEPEQPTPEVQEPRVATHTPQNNNPQDNPAEPEKTVATDTPAEETPDSQKSSDTKADNKQAEENSQTTQENTPQINVDTSKPIFNLFDRKINLKPNLEKDVFNSHIFAETNNGVFSTPQTQTALQQEVTQDKGTSATETTEEYTDIPVDFMEPEAPKVDAKIALPTPQDLNIGMDTLVDAAQTKLGDATPEELQTIVIDEAPAELNTFANAESFEAIQAASPEDLHAYAQTYAKNNGLDGKSDEEITTLMTDLTNIDWRKISKEDLLSKYKDIEAIKDWLTQNQETNASLLEQLNPVFSKFEEYVGYYNLPQEVVQQKSDDFINLILNGANKEVIMDAAKGLIPLAQVRDLPITGKRNPDNDIDSSNERPYLCAEGINNIYQGIKECLESGEDDTESLESLIITIKYAKELGYPISPNALSEEEIKEYQRYCELKDSIHTMIKSEVVSDKIVDSKEFKELSAMMKGSSLVLFDISRDPNNDVLPLTVGKQQIDANYIIGQYKKLTDALREGNTEKALIAIKGLKLANQYGVPISLNELSEEEINNYGTQYYNAWPDMGLNDDFTKGFVKGAFNRPDYKNTDDFGSMAGAMYVAYQNATQEEGIPFFKEIPDPNAYEFLDNIYAIKDKERLDKINTILKGLCNFNSDNPIAEMLEHLPVKVKLETYRHLSYIDPYFKREYEKMKPAGMAAQTIVDKMFKDEKQ